MRMLQVQLIICVQTMATWLSYSRPSASCSAALESDLHSYSVGVQLLRPSVFIQPAIKSSDRRELCCPVFPHRHPFPLTVACVETPLTLF